MTARVLICATQVPFAAGGAEALVDSLGRELSRRGFEVEAVRLPFAWQPRLQVLKSSLVWRLLDLTGTGSGERIDLVIATRFPSYLVKHSNKVVWLVHQFRQVYELKGSRYSDYGDEPVDRQVAEMIHAMDRRTLTEARRLFTISANTARRLDRFLGLQGTPLHPPPPLGETYRAEEHGDYVLGVGRLDALKRFDLLLRVVAACRSGVRCILAGSGPEADSLAALAAELGLAGRVEFAGRVDDGRLVELYARALAVFYAPFDEDYGYVTVEAFKSRRPVLTADDSGGTLEFVEDGVNGFVCRAAAPASFAAAIDRLHSDRALARRLGEAGAEKVRHIGWDAVVAALTSTLPPPP